MAAARGGVKDRIVHEIGRAIKQAQLEWCGVGCVRACTGRWLVLSLDAALLHGLHSLNRGYWPVVSSLLDKSTLSTVLSLPYASKPLTRGRAWLCLCLNEGQLESYLHVLTSHQVLLGSHYGPQALLRDPHRTHLLHMMAAGLEHIKFAIPVDIPGWLASGGSMESSTSMSMSTGSVDSSLPSPSLDLLDLDTSCAEALEESWGIRKKRRSQSSQSSSGVPSVSTTPTDVFQNSNLNGAVLSQAAVKMGQHHSSRKLQETKPQRAAKLNCDTSIYDKNVNNINSDKTENCSYEDSLSKENGKDDTQEKCNGSKVDPGKNGEEVTVVRRGRLPNAKNVEKRVSFTDITDLEHQKPQHNRLSLCGFSEIRDLGDLRDLLSSLKDRGLLPTSLALDDLFISLDQSSPALSERAPPEGQEDPPLHQSIISLTPSNADDDSNNNNSIDMPTDMRKSGAGEDTDEACGLTTAGMQRNNIVDGLRWDELTKMGHELLEKATTDPSILDGQVMTSMRALLAQEQSETGTKPKQKQVMALRGESMMNPDGSLRPQRRISKVTLSSEARRKMYKRSFLKDKEPPSLYIPVKADHNKFRDEERRLALEVAQGQSNLVTPGQIVDYKLDEWIMTHVLALPEEKLYRVFAAREGHSSGNSIAVQIVLSTQTLYVLPPRLKGSKPRHVLPYHDIHTIIVGANDQWVCVLSKEAVWDDLATTGCNTGIQLDVGDPDVTHAIVSSLELAIRRHYATLKLGSVESKFEDRIDYRELFKPGKLKLSRVITRECEENLSNSLLEESLLNAWDTPKSPGDSQDSSEITQDLTPATPVSAVSQDLTEDSQDLTEPSHDLTEPSHEITELSHEITEPSHELSEASHECSEDSHECSEGSHDLIEASCDITEASQDISEASQDMTESSQDLSEASHELTEPSQDSVDTSPDITEASQASEASEDIVIESPRSDNGSQPSSYSSQSESSKTQVHSKIIQTSANTSQESLDDAAVGTPCNGNNKQIPEENLTATADENEVVREEEKPKEQCPAVLHLEKQYGMPRIAGGYNRWNGAKLDHSLPAVIVHPAWELAGLRRWLRAQLRLQSGPEVVGCWMADWEDGSSLGGDSVSGPLGPTNEGSLMYRPPGLLSSWRPAYFILKAGVLYQFNDARERLPHMIVEVVQCVGCVRITTSHRPYAFQLLRKKAPPVLLAASDEHEASQWLQAFLMIINSGVPDVSERKQVSCRVVLLDSGVLLAQQSDLILSLPPVCSNNQSTSDLQSQNLHDTSPRSQNLQALLEREEAQKLLQNPMVSNLKDRKHLSSSLTALNRTSGTNSNPGSPLRRPNANAAERSLTLKKQQHQGSLPRLSDCGTQDVKPSTSREEKDWARSRKVKASPVRKTSTEKRASEQLPPGFKAKGEVKLLTYSALEQLSSIYLYAECPNTCLMEFECSEASEISGDWALYFRTGNQLQEFISTLAHTWSTLSEMEFPVHTVDDAGVQQYLLEGSQICTSGWSSYHL